VVTHSKNHGDTLKSLQDISSENAGSGPLASGERAKLEAQRSERIAKSMNRSSFMGLGENPPKLYSEQDPALVKHVTIEERGAPDIDDPFYDKNASYLSDDSVPTQIYGCIDRYREKARTTMPGNQLALLIDDFFGEAHAIMKDSHLREIARIRNENSVEIMRLKKTISESRQGGSSLSSRDNHTAFKTAIGKLPATSFADNEVERQRRLLIEENGTLK